MERLIGHHYLQELLGAYALDAVEPEEATELERHLETCPRCRNELAEHREVVALLGYAGATAPAGVWDRIVSSLEEPPPAMRLSALPMQRVGPPIEEPMEDSARLAPVVPIDRKRRGGIPARMFVAVVTAAAVIMAGLGVEVGRLQSHKARPLNASAIQSLVYQSAEANPGARRVTLTSADTTKKVPAIVLPDGTSVMGKGDLGVLPKDETYQLWGIVGGQQVSLRVVGSNPDFVTFTTPPAVTVLAMTIEQQGGAVVTTKAPVVSGLVPPVTA